MSNRTTVLPLMDDVGHEDNGSIAPNCASWTAGIDEDWKEVFVAHDSTEE
jgi:hypothetical protein